MRGASMKPWLNGDFEGVIPRENMDALRDVVQSAAHRGIALHAFWLGLSQKDPIACADLAVGPKAIAHRVAVDGALVVIDALEQIVSPSGLYSRLLQLSPMSSEALTVLAARRHPTQPWIWRLDQSPVRGRLILDAHVGTEVFEQSCRRACLHECDGALAELVVGEQMPTVLRVMYATKGLTAALDLAKIALSKHEPELVFSVLAALTGPQFAYVVSMFVRGPKGVLSQTLVDALTEEYLEQTSLSAFGAS